MLVRSEAGGWQDAGPEVVGDCAMQFLLDDRARTKRMSAHLPARANGFSWDTYALRTLEIYREVIAA